MRYGSVCSGIEAATAAWHHMAWEPAFFSEIEAFPRAVLSHHYPEVPLHGDFTTIEKNQYGKIDLLVGGTPCQSFSVAGLRGGLDDQRGNLALEFCRLAQREQPRWIVWENVPGVLSSGGGRDFGSILGALEELGYGLAYRVLDAQYFGVAQRRRRVFVVGDLGDWRPAAAVLFERHSMSGHPAPSREARQDAASGAAAGAGERGDAGGERPTVDWPANLACTLDTDFASKWGQNNQHVNAGCPLFVPDSVGTLRTKRPGEGGVQGDFDHIVPVVSPALNTQSESHHAPDTKAYVAFAQNTRDEVRLVGGDGQIVGALAAQPEMKQTSYIAFSKGDHGADAGDNICPTIRKGGDGGGNMPAVAYSIMPMNSGKDYKARETEVAQPIMAGGPVSGNQGGDFVVTPFDTTQISSPHNYSNPQSGDPCHPLAAGAHPPAVAFEANMSFATPDTSGVNPTLTRRHHASVAIASAVRRLTPVECERLQGFPDNFTGIPWKKKGPEHCPDGPRYKALGNSMAVPVMRWIGERIQIVDDLISLL
jgi:DNA (cytosine-5)-methyltransferase 1